MRAALILACNSVLASVTGFLASHTFLALRDGITSPRERLRIIRDNILQALRRR